METQVEARKRFHIESLEKRVAPAISHVNGGGHDPSGQANGIPATNPAGHEPPGQN
jgi:hypothetical protein